MTCRIGIRIALGAAALLLFTAAPAHVTAAATPTTKAAVRSEAPPFARVYLALRGCTSCAHCRTSIRQMVRSNSKGGEATFGEDRVEVRYPAPRSVPLREVIHSLAQSRLHDLSVVDVLFEATGTVAVSADGSHRFVLEKTGQSFPIELGSAVTGPTAGPVRLTAMVQGWRGKGSLTLVPRELKGT
ncbi:MAG TPA: hypothetical protein VGQ14_04800 [Candidatus Eisenbacteria bacterium]|jgi:hypothetical protein|nr:hypothetical protein [Candidatus Eisenbacteria bacterium]